MIQLEAATAKFIHVFRVMFIGVHIYEYVYVMSGLQYF